MLTPLGISVLALLNERDMHPYEMYQLLLDRHEDRIVKVRPGSLYHAVERLAMAGFVRAIGTERAGKRPERTTYRITSTGQLALTDRIAELIAVPVNEFPAFLVALAESHNLTRTEVLDKLSERVANLGVLIDETEQIMAAARAQETPEAYWLSADYLKTTYLTERDWLSTLASRIESKDLSWPLI